MGHFAPSRGVADHSIGPKIKLPTERGLGEVRPVGRRGSESRSKWPLPDGDILACWLGLKDRLVATAPAILITYCRRRQTSRSSQGPGPPRGARRRLAGWPMAVTESSSEIHPG